MAWTTNLVDYWKMDETSGDMLGAHASKTFTLTGTVGYDTGLVYANAREWATGTPGRIYRNNSDVRFGDVDFTIAIWFYQYTTPPGSGANLYHILLGNDTFNGGHTLGLNGADQLFAQFVDGSGNVTTLHDDVPGTVNNTWHLGLAWYVASGNNCYLSTDNGTAQTDSMANAKAAGGAAVSIGSYSYNNDNVMDGRIGPIMMWTRVLTDDEKTALYNSRAGLSYEAMTATPSLPIDSRRRTFAGVIVR